MAGLEKFFTVIYTELTDDEVALIVTETKLNQRSFADLKYSECAFILYTHYNAIKKKSCYHTDSFRQIDESILTLSASISSVDKLGLEYRLSGDTGDN
jgi:hypothetical protein